MIVVGSIAVALAEPPPDALTALICGVVAVAATFTATAIGG